MSTATTSRDADGRSDLGVVLSGAALLLIGVVSSRLLEFGSRVVLGRYPGPDDFGLLSTGVALLTIASCIVVFGLPAGLVRFIGRYQALQQEHKVPGLIYSALLLVVLGGAAAGAVAWLLSERAAALLLGSAGKAVVVRFAAVALPLSGALAVAAAAFQGLKDARSHVLLSHILVPGTRLAAVIAGALVGWTLNGVLFLYVGALALSAVVALPLLARRSSLPMRLSRSARADLGEVVLYSTPLLAGSLFGLAFWQLDVVLLQRLAGSTQAGLYASAGVIGRLLLVGTSALGFMLAPLMAQQYAAKRLPDMQRLYGRCVEVSFAVGLPFALGVAGPARPLLGLLFGAPYVEAHAVLRILAVGYFAHAITGPNGSTLVMLGRSRLYLMDTLVVASVALLLYALLIPRFGYTGAAGAMIGSLLLLNAVFSIQLFRLTGINPLRWVRARLLIPAAVAGPIGVLVWRSPLADLSEWLSLGSAFVALLACYGGLALALHIVEPREIARVGELLGVSRRGDPRRAE